MSDPHAPQLSESSALESEVTFDVPSILLEAKLADGHIVKTIREGGARQLEMITETKWSKTALDERDQVFAVRAQNVINFAGQRLSVINDETNLGDKRYPASSPSASEYLERVGQKVMLHFNCTKDTMESRRLGVDVFKIVRNTIKLP